MPGNGIAMMPEKTNRKRQACPPRIFFTQNAPRNVHYLWGGRFSCDGRLATCAGIHARHHRTQIAIIGHLEQKGPAMTREMTNRMRLIAVLTFVAFLATVCRSTAAISLSAEQRAAIKKFITGGVQPVSPLSAPACRQAGLAVGIQLKRTCCLGPKGRQHLAGGEQSEPPDPDPKTN